MRSTSRRGQSGQSIVEALVAAAVLGVAGVVGLVALDTGVAGARQVSRQAWASCVQRSEVEAISSSPWNASGSYPAPSGVTVHLDWTSSDGGLQRLTVTVTSPDGGEIARVGPAVVYKALALAPSHAAGADPATLTQACARWLGGQ